ncbi:MAG TPA: SDR family oxidoreductase [Rhizomicrobium sp.]|jgi:short-subunit dehydrogenase
MSGNSEPVVIITGGSSGIGRCTAALFARHGWRVGLIARGAEGLAASRRDVEALGARAASAQADVTDSAGLHAATDAIVAALGPVDLWINCAGTGVYGRFTDVPEADFKRVTDVTYHGAVNGTREALSRMQPRGAGTILNVCSAVAFHGLPLMTSYSGAKAALCAFNQSLQAELRLERSPIRLITVYPPAANTPFFNHAVSYMGWPARPAWPVYQPEVIAQGIWQAFVSGRPEMKISGTTVAFSAASRIAPRLIAWCMARMGFERQMARDGEACHLQEPNLFVPSCRVFAVRGPFGKGARAASSQLWMDKLLTKLGMFAARGRPMQQAVPSPPRLAVAEPDPALADLAAPAGES